MRSQYDFLPQFLTLDEAARFLQLTPQELWEKFLTNQIEAIGHDSKGRYYFSHSDVIAWRVKHCHQRPLRLVDC